MQVVLLLTFGSCGVALLAFDAITGAELRVKMQLPEGDVLEPSLSGYFVAL